MDAFAPSADPAPDSPATPASLAPCSSHPNRLLAAGLVLLLGYFVMSAMCNHFVDPQPAYQTIYNYEPLGLMDKVYDRDFSKFTLLSSLWKLLLLLPATVCLALWVATREQGERLAAWTARLAGVRPGPVLVGLTFAAAALLTLLAWGVFQGQPVYDDERAYEFQATVFRSGHFTAPAPPVPGCFDNVFVVIRDGKWLGKYTAGHSVLLAAGMLAGSPYALPILLGALLPLMTWAVGRELGAGRGEALLGAALLAASPAFLFTSATLMNHATSLFFLALFAWAWLRAEAGRPPLYALVAGLALGAALHIRPQDAVAWGVPLACWSLWRLAREPRRRATLGRQSVLATDLGRGAILVRQGVLALGFAAMAALFFYYNHCVTGHWLTVPYRYHAPASLYGFGSVNASAGGKGEPVGPLAHLLPVAHLLLNAGRMNLWLFGWPLSLVFVAWHALAGRCERRDRVFWALVAGSCAVYLPFSVAGLLELGPRYYFPALLPLALLSARGMIGLHGALDRAVPGNSPSGQSGISCVPPLVPRHILRGAAIVPAFVLLSFALAVCTFDGERALHLLNLTDRVAQPYRAVANAGPHHAVVQIVSQPPSGWVFGYRPPRPDLSDDVIYVRPTNYRDLLELMDRMPDRTFHRLGYDPDRDRITLAPLPREAAEAQARKQEEEAAQAASPPQ